MSFLKRTLFFPVFSLSVFFFPVLLFGQSSEPFPEYYPDLWALRYDSSKYVAEKAIRLLGNLDSADNEKRYHELQLIYTTAYINQGKAHTGLSFQLLETKKYFEREGQLKPKVYALLELIKLSKMSREDNRIKEALDEISPDSSRLDESLRVYYILSVISYNMRTKQFSNAARYIKELEKKKDTFHRILNINAQAGFYINANYYYLLIEADFERANAYADSLIILGKDPGIDISLRGEGYQKKAFFYRMQRQFEKAAEELDKIDTTSFAQDTKAYVLREKARLAAASQDHERAYDLMESCLSAFMDDTENRKKVAVSFEEAKRKLELALKESEIEQERQQRFLYASLSSALLLLVLSLFLLLRLRIRKQKHERLAYNLKLKQAEISERQKQHELEASHLKNKQLHLEKEKQDAELAEQEAIQAQMKLREEQLTLMQAQAEKELSILSLSLLQRNDFFDKTLTELKTASAVAENAETKKVLRGLTRKLRSQLNLEEGWEQFRTHFEHAHNGFFENLQQSHGNRLTENDLKLATFLKMHLTSKEISLMLGISSASVDNARYRLRKKMELGKNESLTEYIAGF